MDRVAGAPVPMRDERGTGRAGEPGVLDPGIAVAAAQRGDTDAFRVLYRDIQPRLLRYLRALVGEDAEDVASETWLQVSLDHLRREARRPPAVLVPTEDLTSLAAADDTAAGALEAVATAAAIRLIATLPREQAEAVLLRAVVGLDAASAGQVLGKRPGAVRTAAYRGLRTLAKQLKQPGQAPR
jgi:RNA polymerase sigma-70 factor (ECF subfamily)